MDEGKFVADFLAKNIENIWKLGKTVFGSVDQALKLKMKNAYGTYLTNTKEKFSRSKSFFIRNKSVDLYSYYIPISISCESTNISLPSFSSCIENSNCIVITGTGGCGKSVLMRHLFLDCINLKKYSSSRSIFR